MDVQGLLGDDVFQPSVLVLELLQALHLTELYADVEKAMAAGEKPEGPCVQALAARWKALVGEFTRGNTDVQKGLNKMWSDQANWPDAKKQQFASYMKPEIIGFMMQAMKVK